MDEEETRNCPNCKREIPAVNFTIHSVHCARNIKVCPVCKEAVPSAELDLHHQQFHKLLPCKQCGESVCGTDLEDHLRDSCANTIKSCRFCSLELPRRELPAHEGYCGVRTEQCAACSEWVMLKYRQLHLDSNHGFIRLDDEPAPAKKEPPRPIFRPPARPTVSANFEPIAFGGSVASTSRTNVANARPKSTNIGPANKCDNSGSRANLPSAGGPARPTSIFDNVGPSNFRNDFPRTEVRYQGAGNSGSSASSSSTSPPDTSASGSRPVTNGVKKRTNDQPQINTNKEVANKVDKDLPISRGAVKKRVAPPPPRAAPPPPRAAPPPPRAAPPPADPRRDMAYYSAMSRQQREERERAEQNQYNLAHGLPPVLNPAAKLEKLRKMDALHNRETEEPYRDRRSPAAGDEERRRQEFRNLKPMTSSQFMERFNSLQLRGAEEAGDRFREIKSSLQELRRGLNEVTAPYNNNNTSAANNNNMRQSPSPREELRLPCEFCDLLVPAEDLVQHQTGCRPDLAQYWGTSPQGSPPPAPPPRARPAPSPAAPPPQSDPVIPCEFCAESLPVYLINEHQISDESEEGNKHESYDNEATQHLESDLEQDIAFETPNVIPKKVDEIQNRKDQADSCLKRISQVPKRDVTSMYCDLLAEKLRGLQEHTQEVAMLEIDELVFNLKRQEKENDERGSDVQMTQVFQQPSYSIGATAIRPLHQSMPSSQSLSCESSCNLHNSCNVNSQLSQRSPSDSEPQSPNPEQTVTENLLPDYQTTDTLLINFYVFDNED